MLALGTPRSEMHRAWTGTHLHEVVPLGEVLLALLGLLEDPRGILLRKAAADGTGLLRPQVEGQVLLVLVEQTELLPLLQVDDGEDTGDRLADVVAMTEMTC